MDKMEFEKLERDMRDQSAQQQDLLEIQGKQIEALEAELSKLKQLAYASPVKGKENTGSNN